MFYMEIRVGLSAFVSSYQKMKLKMRRGWQTIADFILDSLHKSGSRNVRIDVYSITSETFSDVFCVSFFFFFYQMMFLCRIKFPI